MSKMKSNRSLSATTLATHHHLQCDLFLHHSYHGSRTVKSHRPEPSKLSKAQFQKGNDWEGSLFAWLDSEGLLLTVLGGTVTGQDVRSIIECDERDHFFVAGLALWPPNEAFVYKFRQGGFDPVRFALAKPDLVEIRKQEDGTIRWQVIDAKSSKDVKTSHHVQIYFYHLCLQHLLPSPPFVASDLASVWLPLSSPSNPTGSLFDGLKSISTSLLSLPLDAFLFRRLPAVLALPLKKVKWHYNPLCRGCPYESECSARSAAHGELGVMPNISIQDADVLRDVLAATCLPGSPKALTDIEDLDMVVRSPERMRKLEDAYPSTAKKAQRILGLSMRKSSKCQRSSVVDAARTKTTHVINKRNFTFPKNEDIAVVISVLQDPSTSDIAAYAISTFSTWPMTVAARKHSFGRSSEFILVLAETLQAILDLRRPDLAPRTQCYVFSSGERATLQRHLIDAALTSDPTDQVLQCAIRLCIGALCEGAALLATSFQPLLLSGALLDFLGKKGERSEEELQACLERLGLAQDRGGTKDQMRMQIQCEIDRLKCEGGRISDSASDDSERPELGQLPRVVVVKREVERLLALPVPGYWDLSECYSTLLVGSGRAEPCPDDEELFDAYKEGKLAELEIKLQRRNMCVYEVTMDVRRRVAQLDLLVNQARVLSANFMDICKQEHLRKLFFMQQFEVLTKLTELWQARIEGCPDAPLLDYQFTNSISQGTYIHSFTLVSGSVDMPTDKDRSFFDFILTEDKESADPDGQSGIPIEALFDDLSVSNLVFPLNKYTKAKWLSQPKQVQENLFVADIQDLAIQGDRTRVALRTWGSYDLRLARGRRYRLSPRLVNFNLSKVLGTLVELDLQIPHHSSNPPYPPFLQLFVDPRAFSLQASDDESPSLFLKNEESIHSLFRELQGLGSEAAASLVLKPSQRRALRRILSNRLSVIWGPPGTGKTYTIALSLLRLIEIQSHCGLHGRQVIFLTAMTHAAIEACLAKLERLARSYRQIPDLQIAWLENLSIEHVSNGSNHPSPGQKRAYIFAGTVYQLYNFSKRCKCEVDCVVMDEAGQLALGSASLVLRSLRSNGKVIVAGDSEQLAPILTAQYPQLKPRLFGSILDCLMNAAQRSEEVTLTRSDSPIFSEDSQVSTIVQLTENFRLNPDLGDFVSTIYSKAFKPQKAQARRVATQLQELGVDGVRDDDPIERDARNFLLSLSGAMLRSPQITLRPPNLKKNNPKDSLVDDPDLTPRPISLALVRLRAKSSRLDQVAYETHVRGEAAFAASMVQLLQQAAPTENIFVATPHRIQRHAVNEALRCKMNDLTIALDSLQINDGFKSHSPEKGKVTIDTVERLQGSEAAFVICLFSHTHSSTTSSLDFLLERRRLNVAISRAQTLCILVTSEEVLRPSVRVLANADSAKGLAFLRAFEERAWSAAVDVDLDHLV